MLEINLTLEDLIVIYALMGDRIGLLSEREMKVYQKIRTFLHQKNSWKKDEECSKS